MISSCRLCDCATLRPYYSNGNMQEFKFYKCQKCSLVNLDLGNVKITDNQVIYAQSYLNPYDKKKNKGAYKTYSFIKSRIKSKGRYIDIGCGNGALLNYARKDGWKVEGLELSPFMAQNVKETLNIDVKVADFLNYKVTGEKFDLVSLRHVLEHLPDSVLALNKINQMLNKGGFALLEFPNIDGYGFKWKRFLYRTHLHTKKYPDDYREGHCNEFNRKSFQYLVNQTNFRLIRWETYSSKPFVNFAFRHIPVGVKARTLIQKINEV